MNIQMGGVFMDSESKRWIWSNLAISGLFFLMNLKGFAEDSGPNWFFFFNLMIKNIYYIKYNLNLNHVNYVYCYYN